MNTGRVIAPGQPQDTALLVPIDVQALSVRAGAPQTAVPTATTVPQTALTTPDAPDSAVLPRPPQPFGPPTPRSIGVHLHWAMPDALTRGDAGEARSGLVAPGNPTQLPPLPDRWLVVRMPHGTDGCEGFVVEADRARHVRLADWSEPAPLPAGTKVTPEGSWYYPGGQLTATAGGDVAWAATYDAVVDRFAFYDPLIGVPANTRLSYLVVGWWSRPDVDPLAGYFRVGTYLQRCEELGWHGLVPVAVPGGTPVETPPTRTLLHGVISGVTTGVPQGVAAGTGDAAPATADPRPDPAQLEIGLGPTGYAALAAQLGAGTGEQRAASERLLAAFASGMLDRVDEPDGLVAIDEDRHAGAFVGTSAGTGDADTIAEGNPFADAPPTAATPVKPVPVVPARPAAARLEHRAPGDVLAAAQATVDPRPAAAPAVPVTGGIPVTPATPSSPALKYTAIPTARPRYFVQSDVALAVHGAHRSLRHGEDNRLTFNGLLPCVLSHALTIEVANGRFTEAGLPPGLRTLPNTAIPVECQWLLRETVLIDPLRSADRRRWAKGIDADPLDPRLPVWFNRWTQPWVPLWCDWELGVRVDDDLSRWRLGEIDFEPTGTPDAASEVVMSGRALLHAAAGTAFAGQVRRWLAEEDRRDLTGQGVIAEEDETTLAAAADAAAGLDLLGASLSGVRERLLGLDPQRATMTKVNPDGSTVDKQPASAQPQLLAGGAATVRRLRIVDAFGRFVDVPDAVLARLEVAAPQRHPAGAPRFTLAPRFQSPSRVTLRFVDPRPADSQPPREARVDQTPPGKAISPIAGWLLPDHVDEALECFDPAGRPLGQLMHDPLTGAVVFEEAPGRPGSVGGPPDVLDPGTRHVTALADGMVAADVAARAIAGGPTDDSALSALLRGIDTTLSTVDPLGSVGTAAVAGLVGRPIAVVRALLTVDVLSDVDDLSYGRFPTRADRQRAYAELAARAIRIRLGELTRTNDGLLAYFVDDDYTQVRLVAPDVVSGALVHGARVAGGRPSILPIGNQYVADTTDVAVRPRQTVRLTLLLTPGGSVHMTSGVAPRKALALARDWFHEALDRLAPSFRVGPVLVDPTGVRMPRVTGLGEHQTFTRRDTPLTWRDDPILAASQTALLPDDPAGLQEGWIRVLPSTEPSP